MWCAGLARCNLLPPTIYKAFLVAWGGTAAQAGRLTGLVILGLELRKFTIRRREIYIFWVLLFALLGKHTGYPCPAWAHLLSGLVFANNAIAVGTLRYAIPKF